MKALALKLLMKIAKMIGLKKLLKMGWKNLLHPRLERLTKNNDKQWDDKALALIDKYIYQAIDMI